MWAAGNEQNAENGVRRHATRRGLGFSYGVRDGLTGFEGAICASCGAA
jgi:hypothetical protein